jgi:uncharacterized cupredoxin-like copper-binding protein
MLARMVRTRWYRAPAAGPLLMLLAAAGLALGLVGCSSSKKSSPVATATASSTASAETSQTPSAATPSEVTAVLSEWKIKPEPASYKAGSVTFNVRNIGNTSHNLVIVKTDLQPNALPTNADGSVDEAGPGIAVLGKTETIAPDVSRLLTVNLEPGNYVLICNILQTTNGQSTLARPLAHYAQGQAVAFTVTP